MRYRVHHGGEFKAAFDDRDAALRFVVERGFQDDYEILDGSDRVVA